jgi:elongation factor G
VINVKATLYDGSYHPVDSNEISFKLAASLAFKEAVKTCGPTILEPIVKVEVTVKDQYVGDVMGDMSKRRGHVSGMNQADGFQVVVAEVPEAEIVSYAIDLKAMTQGSGSFTREFVRYDEVPAQLIDKIIEAYKK